jgi:hypothetical protein
MFGVQPLGFVADAPCDLDGVGAALLLDVEGYRGNAIHLDEKRHVFVPVAHLRHVLDANRFAADAVDDGGGDLAQRGVLAARAHVEIVQAALDVAAGEIDVAALEGLLHVERRQSRRRQPVAVEIDANPPVQAAAQFDGADAGNLLETP